MSLKRIYRSAKSELIEHKKTRIISLILIIVFGILQFFANVISEADFPVNYVPFCFLLFILFVVCKNIFKDMYENTAADVQMSLPISSKERYFSHLMTIGMVFWFPFIIISVFSNIVSFLYIRHCYLEKLQTVGYSISFYTRYFLCSGDFNPVFSDFFKYELILIAVSLFIIAVTAFSISCIGSKSESLYIPVLLVFVFSLFPVLFLEFVTSKFLIFSADLDNIRILKMIPGLPLLFFDFEDVEFIDIIINIILSVAVLLLGLAAFEKRDVKSVGKPVVHRVFYEFLMFLSSVIIFMVSYVDGNKNAFIIINIVGIIGMSILRILGSRKEFHVSLLLKWLGIYVLYYIGFVVLMFAVCKTNLFGYAQKCFNDNYSDVDISCEITTYYNDQLKQYANVNDYYHDYNRRNYYYEDDYSDEEFKLAYPNVEREIVPIGSFFSKNREIAKIFSKYNNIAINKPGYFAYTMFFHNKRTSMGICSVDFFILDAKRHDYYINNDIRSFLITKEEYDNLNDELMSIS